jgi:hypothetical protein
MSSLAEERKGGRRKIWIFEASYRDTDFSREPLRDLPIEVGTAMRAEIEL